jgi:hypothetical protein
VVITASREDVMKILKALNLWCVVLMVLVLTFTTVQADSILSPLPNTGVENGASSPYILYPLFEDVFTKTPLFRFTDFSAEGATKYRIDVWVGDDLDADPLYTYKGVGDCDGAECTMQPGIPLKKADFFGNGHYTWRIRAKVAGEWPILWSQAQFTVRSSGFTSYFSSWEKKWLPVQDTWTVNSKGYLKTFGTLNQLSSIMEKHEFTNGFVYEVKLKRKTSNGDNYVYFQGYPDPLGGSGYWDDGYYFTYRNDTSWALIKYVDGASTLITGGPTLSYIKPYDWNKITIMRSSSEIKIWINKQYIGTYSDATFSSGYVGIGMYKKEDIKDPLLVDWATLEYTDTAPYAIP